MLRHIVFKRESRLDVIVQGSVVLSGEGDDPHYIDVASIKTTEGIDLMGLLPAEEMAGIKDELITQAEIDAEREILVKMLPPVDLAK